MKRMLFVIFSEAIGVRMMSLQPQFHIAHTHLPSGKTGCQVTEPGYCLPGIAVLFALHFDFDKVPYSFDLIYTYDDVLTTVADSAVLNTRQFDKAIAAEGLFDRICCAPLRQKAGEEGMHLLCLGGGWPQREGTLRTLYMGRVGLGIELEFQALLIAHPHEHGLTQQVKPGRVIVDVGVMHMTHELHRWEVFLELRLCKQFKLHLNLDHLTPSRRSNNRMASAEDWKARPPCLLIIWISLSRRLGSS